MPDGLAHDAQPRPGAGIAFLLSGSAPTGSAFSVLIAFHKPYGVLSQFTPEPGSPWRPLASFGLPAGVYALGRLDADSEGLLLFSDEAGLNTRLLDPTQAHPREYWAQVERVPTLATLAKLTNGGIDLGSYRTRPARAQIVEPVPTVAPRDPPVRYRKNVADAWLSLELTEGKNRQVRRMTAAVGHPTLRLIRVRIGTFKLDDLPIGRWRPLSAQDRLRVFNVDDGAASAPCP